MRFKKGDIVTVKRSVEGYYSGYGGKPKFYFSPANIGTVIAISPKVKGRGDFLVVDFASSTTRQVERVGIDPSNAIKVKEKKMTKRNPHSGPVDESAAKELYLFISNDGDLYRQQYLPIIKNLVAKIDRGIYDRGKAIKLFMYLMESGAKKYSKEYSIGTDWNRIFSKATRELVAKNFVASFETEYKLGNYSQFHAKKYQKSMGALRNPGQYDDIGTGKYDYMGMTERVKIHSDKASEFDKKGDTFNAVSHAKAAIRLANSVGLLGSKSYEKAVKVLKKYQK